MLIFGGVPVDVSRRPTNQTGESCMTTVRDANDLFFCNCVCMCV